MKNHFKLILAMLVISLGVLFTSCASSRKAAAVSVTDKKEMPKQVGVPAEVEIVFPCSGIDSDEEFLRVNGNGSSKDRTMAKDRAYQNALAALSVKLARVAVSVNADGEDFHDKMVAVSKVVAQANVAGYRTSCEKYTVNPSTGAYNCYVTIEFGKQKIVKEMYEALSNQKLLKADYDFDRYLEMFNEDLKKYEEANK